MPVDSDHRTSAPFASAFHRLAGLERILLSSVASQSILRAKAGDNGPFVGHANAKSILNAAVLNGAIREITDSF
jgi:hypothetical protein